MSDAARPPLTSRQILVFWLPLAATWLMMSAEGPFLAAVIARLSDPKFNLAAYGVAYALALVVEAPIIMIMSAATALVRDRQSYLAMRNYTNALNALVTAAMVVLVLPPVFDAVAVGLLGLPEEVAHLTWIATLLLLPWPGAIGIRRFYQGVLIRGGLTRRVAYGTVIRLAAMVLTAIVLYRKPGIEGAWVGAAALTVGVLFEAVVARAMAHPSIKTLLGSAGPGTPLSYGAITTFYYPLALTTLLSLGLQPVVTFFMGHSVASLESLAVLPVVLALVFIFRSLGLAYQEVGIALIGDRSRWLCSAEEIRNHARRGRGGLPRPHRMDAPGGGVVLPCVRALSRAHPFRHPARSTVGHPAGVDRPAVLPTGHVGQLQGHSARHMGHGDRGHRRHCPADGRRFRGRLGGRGGRCRCLGGRPARRQCLPPATDSTSSPKQSKV